MCRVEREIRHTRSLSISEMIVVREMWSRVACHHETCWNATRKRMNVRNKKEMREGEGTKYSKERGEE